MKVLSMGFLCRKEFVVELFAMMFAIIFLMQPGITQVSPTLAQRQMTPKQVIQKYIESGKRINTLHAKATEHVVGYPDATSYHECSVDFGQKKYHWLQSDSSELEESKSKTRYLESTSDTTSRLSATKSQSGGVNLNFRDDGDAIVWDISFAQTPFGAPLHFYELSGVTKPAYQFIESLPFNLKWQVEEGLEYAVLFVESRGCCIDLWLDPQRDFAVKKFLFSSKTNEGLALGVKLYSYEVNEFGKKEDFYFPKKIMTVRDEYERETMIYAPGLKPEKGILRARTIKSEISFNDVEINPKLTESSFRLKKEPDDYTPVTVINKFQIEHVWLDGKIIPLTDEVALARARGHGFIPGIREPRFWLMAIGAAMILFALCAKIYYYLRPKGDDK